MEIMLFCHFANGDKTENCLYLPNSTHVGYGGVEMRTLVHGAGVLPYTYGVVWSRNKFLLFVPLPSHSIAELPSQSLNDITDKSYSLLVSVTH